MIKTGYEKLAAIVADDYGVGIMVAGKEAVLWAAELLAESDGAEVATAQVSAMNARREKLGRPLVYLPFDHPAF